MRRMKLDPIVQGEVSQKEKHQYNILMHIYEIYKDGNDNPICETAKDHMYIKHTIILCERRQGWDDLRE